MASTYLTKTTNIAQLKLQWMYLNIPQRQKLGYHRAIPHLQIRKGSAETK